MFETRRLRGYTDFPSFRPGENARFFVSSDVEQYEATLVRLIHADPNPEGPGFIEEEVAPLGAYPGKRQISQVGSYVTVPSSQSFSASEDFTVHFYFQATLPGKKKQVLISRWDEKLSGGWSVELDEQGRVRFRIGDGAGAVRETVLSKKVFGYVWYSATAQYRASNNSISIRQRAVVNSFNSRFGPVVPLDSDDYATLVGIVTPLETQGPLIIGGLVSDARAETIRIEDTFNGKIDSPSIARGQVDEDGVKQLRSGASPDGNKLIAAWDFAAKYSPDGVGGDEVVDVSGHGHNGTCVNQPTQGCTGWNWQGKRDFYGINPEQYGALWFHDDGMDDCRWDVSFDVTLPENLRSGVYAARLRGGGLEEHITFFVAPKRDAVRAPVAIIMSTFTYMAYSNRYAVPHWREGDTGFRNGTANGAEFSVSSSIDMEVDGKVDPYGLGNYDRHSDGTGVIYATWRKPMLMIKPNQHRTWNWPGDMMLVHWFEHEGLPYDIITDHDIDAEGVAELKKYKAVVTVSHPEYCTTRYIDAWEEYLVAGGRGVYLGANGMYWATALDPKKPWLMEVRRGEVGDGLWHSEPGEYYMSSTGENGGLWRNRGRSSFKIWGTGYTGHSLEQGAFYAPLPDSKDKRVSWLFEGIDLSEPIGDFGLTYAGASAVELDRYDLAYGTPPHTLLLASSVDHSPYSSITPEDWGPCHPYVSGVEHPGVRADMTYFSTPNGGAMFAVSSIGWVFSLSHNNFDNNVAQLMRNLVSRFSHPEVLPEYL